MDYRIPCLCGQTLAGERKPRFQVVPCPGCGRGIFILPVSPYERPEAPVPEPPWNWSAWRAPILAGAACLGVVVAGFLVVLPHLSRTSTEGSEGGETNPATDPTQEIEAGLRALGQGKFHIARHVLDRALTQRDRLEPARTRDAYQLLRQADLLARLCQRSVEEVVHHATLVRDPEEWERQFADYRGRSILLDDRVRRDEDGHPRLAHHRLIAGDEPVRLALEDLTLFRDLPLEEGVRMFFGARLARCQREQGGSWVIRFEPNSGVLVTQPEAFEACFPAPLDEGVEEVLERQRRWVEGFPANH